MRGLYPDLKPRQLESVRGHLVEDVRGRNSALNIAELERRLEAGGCVAVHALISHPKLHRIQREAALAHIAEALEADLSPKDAPHRPKVSERDLMEMAHTARQLAERANACPVAGGEELLLMAAHWDGLAGMERERREYQAKIKALQARGPGTNEARGTWLAFSLDQVIGPFGTMPGVENPNRRRLILPVINTMIEPMSEEQLRQRLLSHRRRRSRPRRPL